MRVAQFLSLALIVFSLLLEWGGFGTSYLERMLTMPEYAPHLIVFCLIFIAFFYLSLKNTQEANLLGGVVAAILFLCVMSLGFLVYSLQGFPNGGTHSIPWGEAMATTGLLFLCLSFFFHVKTLGKKISKKG